MGQLGKRQDARTCGYTSGSADSALTCYSASRCYTDDINLAIQCCPTTSYYSCNVATVCLDRSEYVTRTRSVSSGTAWW
ncbi:hypothetical protein B0T17DRAFT_133857 [Bombardia bombarda]|uniref:Uncharacterized protein n=1 Tax=Bombardia bombarda TaxID=252184 RepID=A0AA39TQP2_9PEZI|nr:hypothetical protein B0T17DRAFT_133857 [Bombardia bombarda]